MPNNTTKTVPHGISNFNNLIFAYGAAGANIIPLASASTNWLVEVLVGKTNINITTKGDYSANTAYITILYTKTTD